MLACCAENCDQLHSWNADPVLSPNMPSWHDIGTLIHLRIWGGLELLGNVHCNVVSRFASDKHRKSPPTCRLDGKVRLPHCIGICRNGPWLHVKRFVLLTQHWHGMHRKYGWV